jgi:hypothetical protein
VCSPRYRTETNQTSYFQGWNPERITKAFPLEIFKNKLFDFKTRSRAFWGAHSKFITDALRGLIEQEQIERSLENPQPAQMDWVGNSG